MSYVSKRLPNPPSGRKSNGVILVGHGVLMIKFNSNTVIFLIFFIFQYLVLIEMLTPWYSIEYLALFSS